MAKRKPITEVEGRTIRDWNRNWIRVEGGFGRPHPELRHKVGLYRAILNGRVMAIGKGADRQGGLAKRIADFRRDSDSARDHHAGELIHEHLHELELQVLITGSTADPAARWTAVLLKTPMIRLHNPRWTSATTKFGGKQRRSDTLPIAA